MSHAKVRWCATSCSSSHQEAFSVPYHSWLRDAKNGCEVWVFSD